MNWKFTDASNRVVARTLPDGRTESCLVEAIADWIAAGNTPDPADPPPIPAVVAKKQAKLALLQVGLLDTVEAAIAAAPRNVQIEWNDSETVQRNYLVTQMMVAQLGITDAQLDDLFTLAATL